MAALILVGKGKSVALHVSEVLKTMRQLDSEYFFLRAAAAIRSSDPVEEERGSFQFAALLREQTKGYPRQRQILDQMTHTEFAARALVAWHDYWRNERSDSLVDPEEIVRYCRRHVARQLDEALEVSGESQTPLESIPELAAEDFFASESARLDLEQLTSKAGLSPRESELFELKRLDGTATSAELAEKMGINEVTVRAMSKRIKTKFKRAANL